MRLKRKTEVAKVADEIIAQLNQRWRRPLNETAATFEFIGKLKFKTEGDDARCAAVLRSALGGKMTFLFTDEQIDGLRASIDLCKRELTAIATGRKSD
jgi:hypothetical protein